MNLYKQELVARWLMSNAEKHRYLSKDQHGGRNGQEALDIVIGKTITFETLHFQQAKFCCTDCDAKACYNRIAPLVLLLAYYKAGLPYQCCMFLATMLYSLRYVLTTAFSEAPYVNWHKFIVAVFGIGQGATDGPAGLLFISNIILKCYSQLSEGCRIFDPGKTTSVSNSVDMFVDNNTLMHNTLQFDATPALLMNHIQKDAELWGRFFRITGGLLEFLKRSYFLVIWTFAADGQPSIQSNLPPNTAHLTDAQGSTTKLK
eukprot:5384382-Ditylum_brightwellii.AAC.1